MEKYLICFKVGMTGILSFIFSILGGFDKPLMLLVELIIFDIITGVVLAIINKNLSSNEMRNGLVRKVLIFVGIILGCTLDNIFGLPKDIDGFNLSIRMLFIIYPCIDEGISLIENLANIGVPFPFFIKDILVQVKDCTNKSSTKAILNFIKKYLDSFIGSTKNSDNEDDECNNDEYNNKDESDIKYIDENKK